MFHNHSNIDDTYTYKVKWISSKKWLGRYLSVCFWAEYVEKIHGHIIITMP